MPTNVNIQNIGNKPARVTMQELAESKDWPATREFTLLPGEELPRIDETQTTVAAWVSHNKCRVLITGQGPLVVKSLGGTNELKISKLTPATQAKTLALGKKPIAWAKQTTVYIKPQSWMDIYPDATAQFLIEESPT